MSSSADSWAVIVAAGLGKRFGSGAPKQFAPLAGKPMVIWSLEAFREHGAFAGVSIVVPREISEAPPDWLARLASEGVVLAEGGAERTDSVRLGLATVPPGIRYVAIHDAARPLITTAAISRVLAKVGPQTGAVAGRPVTDSLKEADSEGRVLRAIDRQRLWRAETPQIFPRDHIIEIYRQAERDGFVASDSASLCERYGLAVSLVDIDDPNPKVTRTRDLDLVEAILVRQGRARPAE